MAAALPAVRIKDMPEEFFIDLAVGVNPFVDVCDNYNLTEAEAVALEADPVFRRRLRIAKQAVDSDGTAFRSRCRVAVADSVHRVVHMVNDNDVPASTQLDAFKTLVKYGELEPKRAEGGLGNGTTLTLNIVGPNGQTGLTIESEATAVAGISEEEIEEAQFDAAENTPLLVIVPPATAAAFGAE